MEYTMDVHSLLPIIGVLSAAAITPGPNNFLVMDASARGGMVAAGAVVLGVLLGSLLLLALVFLGVQQALQTFPMLRAALSVGGGAYLAWLGVALMLRGAGNPDRQTQRVLPASVWGVAVFQLLNPKAWMLITTALAAMPDAGGVVGLAVLIALVSSICLSAWAVAGSASSRLLAQPGPRLWFDRSMGGLLALSALGVIVGEFVP
jgi:threonine/homoserine/homoserine lactone efflux protein